MTNVDHTQPGLSGFSQASADDTWRRVAHERLVQLMDRENEIAATRDRLAILQGDYRKLLAQSLDHLHQLRHLHEAHAEAEARLARLAAEHALSMASITASRSWRMTRPLRALSTRGAKLKRLLAQSSRAMLRVDSIRRVARVTSRMAPGLSDRIRSKLYPGSHVL